MLVKINEIIRQKLSRFGVKKQIEAIEVCEAADFVVCGKFRSGFVNDAKTVSFLAKKKAVTIAVSTRALCCELKCRELELVEKINNILGEKKVEKINFTVIN